LLNAYLQAFCIACLLATRYEASLIWPSVSATFCGYYLLIYTHTLESVPKNLAAFVALMVFGLSWPVGKFYSTLLAVYIEDIDDILFWHAIIVLILSGVRSLLTQTKSHEEEETIIDFCKNPFARRYFGIILLLWTCHGYIYYSATHRHSKASKDLSQVYETFSDIVAKILTTALVLKVSNELCWFNFIFSLTDPTTEGGFILIGGVNVDILRRGGLER